MRLYRRVCNLLTTTTRTTTAAATLTTIRGSFRQPLHLLHFLKLPAKVCQAMSTRRQAAKEIYCEVLVSFELALCARARTQARFWLVGFQRRGADEHATQVGGFWSSLRQCGVSRQSGPALRLKSCVDAAWTCLLSLTAVRGFKSVEPDRVTSNWVRVLGTEWGNRRKGVSLVQRHYNGGFFPPLNC